MKKIFIICFILIISLTACGSKTTVVNSKNKLDAIQSQMEALEREYNSTTAKEFDENDTQSDFEKYGIEVGDSTSNVVYTSNEARYGTKTNPIKINELGIIESYNTTSKEYEKLYMKITEVMSQSDSEKILDDYNNSAIVTYKVDTNEYDIHAVKAEVDLKDFPTSDNGLRSPNIVFVVRSLGVSDTTFGDVRMSLGTSFAIRVDRIGSDNLHQGDVVEMYLVYALPKGFKENHLLRVQNGIHDDETAHSFFLIDK